MGKYMRRPKTTGDFAVMEASPQSSFGVRTRAKTLALQRLLNPSASTADCFSFLQLRSRRLEKLPPLASKSKDLCKETVRFSPNPDRKLNESQSREIKRENSPGAANYASVVLVSPRSTGNVSEPAAMHPPPENDAIVEAEVSFGENALEVEELNREVRETTPNNIVRCSDDIGTPVSSTRSSNSITANRNSGCSVYWDVPTTREMEEFFTGAEQSQLKLFKEKYNYDPVNDHPLPGRYEWSKF